jgi:cysteine-rich repeat protein
MLFQKRVGWTALAVAVATVACGDDKEKLDAAIAPADAGMDATVLMDAAMDTGVPTGQPDTGVPVPDAAVDAGMDANVTPTDAGMDATVDAGMDATVDAGDAGDAAEPDTGTDSAVDPCDSVSDPCDTAGLTCDGTELVECAADGDGCLVETRTECDSGSNNYCASTEDSAECAYDPCLEVANPCTDEGTSCDGNELVECELDSDDCLVETRTDCIDGTDNFCDDSGDPAECAFDPCKDVNGADKEGVCVIDDTTCADDILVDCVPDGDGCPIATPTDCTMEGGNNFCNGELEPPDCDYDPCLEVANPCFPEGVVCDGTEIVTCAPDLDECLVETREQCADMGASFTCAIEDPDDGGVGGPTCAPCADDPECDSGQSEGDLACDGNDLVLCTDNTGDGCLNAVREDCGDDFTCCSAEDDPAGCPAVAEPRCEYTASATCDSDIEAVLDGPGTYGPFDTSEVSTGNEFNGFPCPDPALPFNAASPDLLFAIDIPSGTALSVNFEMPMGFGSTGVWMLQLSECADGAMPAEDSCVAVSNMGLTQANETNTTQRFYLVVDADDIFPAQDNTGTFGLVVDIRPLGCGDGHQDGSEECDDANTLPNDGCAPDCTLEENFVCTQSTQSTPSVCTRRADVCGNVQCDPLPDTAPSDAELCCTPTQECGVALPSWYGGSCLTRDQMGTEDADQCGTEGAGLIGFFFGFPTLQGCCRPDGDCGLLTDDGAGCVERTALWGAMLDGPASAIYDGPFGQTTCTP